MKSFQQLKSWFGRVFGFDETDCQVCHAPMGFCRRYRLAIDRPSRTLIVELGSYDDGLPYHYGCAKLALFKMNEKRERGGLDPSERAHADAVEMAEASKALLVIFRARAHGGVDDETLREAHEKAKAFCDRVKREPVFVDDDHGQFLANQFPFAYDAARGGSPGEEADVAWSSWTNSSNKTEDA